MTFTAPHFALFFVVVLAFWARLRGPARKYFLLAASYVFYGYWSLGFLALLAGTTVVDATIARSIGATDNAARRKRLLVLSIVVNLGVLGFFKYCNFFIDSAVVALRGLGIDAQARTLDIVLPVGISFHTFQSMSYTIDVYRRHLAPARSLVDFALYVSFFPQLVAGPIERATHLLPQCERVGTPEERPSDPSGWGLIALGAFKKAVIADHLAALVELTYSDPAGTWPPALWLGTYAFAIQIYFDFSGYSDIAVGVGRLLGFEIMQNFRSPYAASGPSEFWQRWHISLSSWLRDYLYIPLGGNRLSAARTRVNLFLTMLLGGLWHGAAWNFVLWGAYQGALLVLARTRAAGALAATLARPPYLPRLWPYVRWFVFFHLVCLGWALFRAESLSDCVVVLTSLLDVGGWDLVEWFDHVHLSGEGRYLAICFAVIVGVLALQNRLRASPDVLVARLWRLPPPVRIVIVLTVLGATILFSPEKPPPFIYFQF